MKDNKGHPEKSEAMEKINQEFIAVLFVIGLGLFFWLSYEMLK